jgi:hypothetical protein
MPPAWKEYQEAAAAYYRELGLSAETDETIVGARGRHAVDVVVRGYRAGVNFLWIVECKWWNRRVPKAAVLTLSGIMLDVGADRGIILSRRGFQSGAPSIATKSNISLTSLEELKADTGDEYINYRCGELRRRCESVVSLIHTSGLETLRRRDDDPFDWPDILIGARANGLKTTIEEALGDRWPVGITRVKDGLESYAFIDNMPDLLAVVNHVLKEIRTTSPMRSVSWTVSSRLRKEPKLTTGLTRIRAVRRCSEPPRSGHMAATRGRNVCSSNRCRVRMQRKLTSHRDTPKSCQSSPAIPVNLPCISTIRYRDAAKISQTQFVVKLDPGLLMS